MAGSIWITVGGNNGDVGINEHGELVFKRGEFGKFVVGKATVKTIDQIIENLQHLKIHAVG